MPIDLDQGVRVQRGKDHGEIAFDEIALIPASDIARAHEQQLPGPAVQEVREIKAGVLCKSRRAARWRKSR